MKSIYSPWRHGYITKNKKNEPEKTKTPSGCRLCQIIEQGVGPESLVAELTESCALLLNKFPYSPGHLMILPRGHIGRYQDLSAQFMAEKIMLIERSKKALTAAFGAQAFHIGYNLGHAGGAGIPEHLHMHIVPRYQNDHQYDVFAAQTSIDLKDCFKKIKSSL